MASTRTLHQIDKASNLDPTRDMKQPERLDSLDDLKAWIYEHDGRIGAWWAEQRRTNAGVSGRLDNFASRLSAVEKRMMWFAGFAAAGGAMAGNLLSKGLGG